LLKVTGKAYRDEAPIWEDDPFPVRFPVKVLIALRPETAVPIIEMRDRLSIFKDLANPHAWTGRLRGSPAKWTKADGLAVLKALEQAKAEPVERPLDHLKLKRRSPFFRSSDDSFVSIPDNEIDALSSGPPAEEVRPAQGGDEISAHLQIQWLLAKLGSDMGLKVWVARNDRNRSCKGHTFTSLPNLITELPVQFDDATRRTIELIDVLWLKGSAVVAAFEIESTTSIYSGLLRMSDLISMQPNLAMPLYIVAPDERRDKVKEEILRPTFSKLPKPLSDLCRYISFSALRSNVEKVKPYARHLNPEFLSDFAEVFAPDLV
jgi:hypothetical protein